MCGCVERGRQGRASQGAGYPAHTHTLQPPQPCPHPLPPLPHLQPVCVCVCVWIHIYIYFTYWVRERVRVRVRECVYIHTDRVRECVYIHTDRVRECVYIHTDRVRECVYIHTDRAYAASKQDSNAAHHLVRVPCVYPTCTSLITSYHTPPRTSESHTKGVSESRLLEVREPRTSGKASRGSWAKKK